MTGPINPEEAGQEDASIFGEIASPTRGEPEDTVGESGLVGMVDQSPSFEGVGVSAPEEIAMPFDDAAVERFARQLFVDRRSQADGGGYSHVVVFDDLDDVAKNLLREEAAFRLTGIFGI
jgi:hypothetical protein